MFQNILNHFFMNSNKKNGSLENLTNNQLTNSKHKKVILLVLDGFGVNPKLIKSPWKYAKIPFFHEIEKFYPFTALQASGIAVGLPYKEAGNSEVGHLTMGSGRIIYTALPRISFAIEDGTFFKNEVLLSAINKVNNENSALHFIGLYSSGSVHSYSEHLHALLALAFKNNIKQVFLHLFTDGRDAPQTEAADFILELEKKLAKIYKNTKIASVIGRDFAMDRNDYFDKIEKTYFLLTRGEGEKFNTASEYIKKCYARNISDEYIPSAVLKDNNGHPQGIIKNKDAVIFFNFREDSMRELVSAFASKNFNKFKRDDLNNVFFVTIVEYEKNLTAVAFLPLDILNPLAKVFEEAKLKQLHIAETEKYAHVTYFFNGGKEEPFQGENRILIPSLRDANFEEAPEMSAFKIKEEIINNIDNYDFILANFANADMVGHTGNFQATVKAFEVLDTCVHEIIVKAEETEAVVIITGDHGNAEEKTYAISGEKKTEHSINPVPFYLVSKKFMYSKPEEEEIIKEKYQKIQGSLMDISPTILDLMELKAPREMTGISLLNKLIN